MKPVSLGTALGMVAALCVGQPLSAQALFARPDTIPNYAAYRHVEECLAAIDRLTTEVRLKDTVWADTAEFDLAQEDRALPPIAREMGRRCLAKVSVDTLSLKDIDLWVPALLMVDRDADAERWYTRLLDTTPVQERPQRLLDIMGAIRAVRPVRIALARRVYARAQREISPDSVMPSVMVLFSVVDIAMQAGDTVLEREAYDQMDPLIDRIPPEEKTNIGYRRWIGPMLYRLLQMATHDRGMDSLTKSNEAFVAYRKTLWARVSNLPFETSEEPIGETALPVNGDFWFASGTASRSGGTSPAPAYVKTNPSVRPVPGKINIIAFLQGGCHSSTPLIPFGRSNGFRHCWPAVSVVRRLKRAYPDAEVTVVTKTFGSLGDAPPLEPVAEADTLAKFFQGFHRLPATLVVTSGPFFRLPGLDQRVIDQDTKNETDYHFPGEQFSLPGSVFLVDGDGKIFFSGILDRYRERQAKKMLNAVYRRGGRR